jgi:hypothetical protein
MWFNVLDNSTIYKPDMEEFPSRPADWIFKQKMG